MLLSVNLLYYTLLLCSISLCTHDTFYLHIPLVTVTGIAPTSATTNSPVMNMLTRAPYGLSRESPRGVHLREGLQGVRVCAFLIPLGLCFRMVAPVMLPPAVCDGLYLLTEFSC